MTSVGTQHSLSVKVEYRQTFECTDPDFHLTQLQTILKIL